MVIVILLNYLLVLFDLSYIPFHDFWQLGQIQLNYNIPNSSINFPTHPLKVLPFRVTDQYDWIKGIEPYQTTVDYLNKVNQLKQIDAEKTEDSEEIFADLRNLTAEMLQLNSLEVVHQNRSLEIINNRMSQHIYGSNQASAEAAFRVFWSSDYFQQQGISQELEFFEQQISPLMQTLYFRSLDGNGQPIDYFYLLDLPFITFFFLEFLWRTRLISRHYLAVTWTDAMFWRWYDVFLFLPFWRFLRIIPLMIRLNHAKFFNLKTIQRQFSQGFVSSFAEDLVQVVVIRVINQIQSSIGQGDIQKFIKQRYQQNHLLDNQRNEIAEILKIIFQTTVHKVLPKIKPDAEALLKYNFEKALAKSAMYQSLQKWPGMKNLENQMGEQFSSHFYQAFSETLIQMTKEDAKANRLFERLLQTFNQELSKELQGKERINQLESLVTEFLEEFKINYVKPLSAEDLEVIFEQTRILREQGRDLTLVEPTLIRRSDI
ncbi:hypothetical protein CFPU101_07710 [Chroococcus sp. FPU101]|nr:hypothetical protein CFPU101_07710 [Chroococcus sp. FPU101]